MKKLLILLFSILLSFNSYGGLFDKTVCVETDAQMRNGIIYLPNETKPFTGKNLCLYENGQYKSEGKIEDGKKDGIWTIWHDNGQIKSELSYRDNSVFEIEYTSNMGYLIPKETYYKDNKKYKSITYWNDGNIHTVTHYQVDEIRKTRTFWHNNGQKSSETNLKYGLGWYLDGKNTRWSEDGQIESESNWKDGECISGDCD